MGDRSLSALGGRLSKLMWNVMYAKNRNPVSVIWHLSIHTAIQIDLICWLACACLQSHAKRAEAYDREGHTLCI